MVKLQHWLTHNTVQQCPVPGENSCQGAGSSVLLPKLSPGENHGGD